MSFATDGQDGRGLQIKKWSQIFQILPFYLAKIAKRTYYGLFSI